MRSITKTTETPPSPGYLLQHLAFTLMKQTDVILLEQIGIGFSQYKILRSLQHQDSVQQKQIAQYLGQTEASISRQIHVLEGQGLIKNVVRKENRREHTITLTDKGEKLLDHAVIIVTKYHAPMFEHLSRKEQESLQTILEKMYEVTHGKVA